MIKINTVIYFTLMFVIISAVYLVENKVQSLRAQINKQVYDIKQFKQDTHVLQAEWSYLNNPERLRKLATSRITVDSPKSVQITDVDAIPLRTVITASN